jgi:hypothetical protein
MEATKTEEQDIGLLYLARSGSFTGSSTETIASRLPTRQPSPAAESHAPIDAINPLQVPLSPIKSPSLSNVRDTHSGLRMPTVALARSRTLSHLPISDPASSEPVGFEFERDRALRMSQWVLAFIIGECPVISTDIPNNSMHHSQF